MKKYSIKVWAAVAAVCGMISCTNAPRTVSGVVYDASMNNIMLITENGDTMDISTMNADPANVPGVLIDDSVRITYRNVAVDGMKVRTAERLEVLAHSPYYYIQGTWLEPNPIDPSTVQGFRLEPDGTAASIGMATLQLRSWDLEPFRELLLLETESIGNGQTIAGTDTLHVERLDADSLVLTQHGAVVWRLARQQ